MTQLSEILDVEKLRQHVLAGHVSQMWHHENPYICIYNYTHVCQHDNIWDDVTELTRGLIVDTISGEVLARPFRKFFNLNTSFRPETMEENLPTHKPRVLEKLDGSLGILYHFNDATHSNYPAISTRGSFHSDQAKWASDWYRNHCRDRHDRWQPADSGPDFPEVRWPEGYTPLFEIIYKENRIVVNYEFEGLVLLGLVNIATGFELSPEEVDSWGRRNGFRTPSEYKGCDLESLKSDKTPNSEGFVLQYWSGKAPCPLRVKVKTEDYCRLHKIITGLNPKGIWEHLSKGYDGEALWLPASHNQQFTNWCIGWVNTFKGMYDKLENEAIKAFGSAAIEARRGLAKEQSQLDARATRKYYAMAFQKEASNLAPVLFAMLDGKDYKPAIWAQLEPKIQGKEVYIRDADTNNGI